MDPSYTLYSYYRSSCSWRVRLALELKGLVYRTVPVDLLGGGQDSESYLGINPAGVVPALVLGDGTVLTQSVAILEYLEEAHLDFGALKRALTRQLVQVIVSDCQPLQNLHVLRRFRSLCPAIRDDNEAKTVWGRHYIIRALEVYAELIKGGGGKFSVGEDVSLADLCLIPQLYNARRFGIEVETKFPELLAIEANFKEIHPIAFSKAHPDNSQ